MSDRYIPPFHVTAEMVALVSEISEMVGSITAWDHLSANSYTPSLTGTGVWAVCGRR